MILTNEDLVHDSRVQDAVAKLWPRRWWVVAITSIFTAGFTLTAFLMTPIYEATTILVSASAERGSGGLGGALGQLGGLAAIAGVNVGSKTTDTDEALAVLRSRQFSERFLNDYKLASKLFPSEWDSVNNKWKVDVLHQPTPAKAFRYFDKEVRSVSQDKKTGLIALHIQWRDRIEAAEWANELVRRLNEEMRSRAISTADLSIKYLNNELSATEAVTTRDAIGRLVEAQIKQRMLANVTPEYSFRIVDAATPPDKDDKIRPKRLQIVVAGPLVGIAVAITLILLIDPLRLIFKSIGSRRS